MLSAIIQQAGNTFLASIGWAVTMTYAGSKISYFANNDLSLPRFRPGGNDSKNRSERFRDRCFLGVLKILEQLIFEDLQTDDSAAKKRLSQEFIY